MSILNTPTVNPFTVNPSNAGTAIPVITVAPNTGQSGQYLYSNGSSTMWSDANTIATITTGTTNATLQVNGDANFDGDVKIQGKSIARTLEKIEEKLAILHPNEKLEEKWEQLRDLRNQYIKLEEEIKEKEKIWGILKR
jgi:hypothetical protein